ncbi:MAG TPA: SDR family oxidoreductase, partial [Polyangiaceae bacterium]|nr:SDR family oxidoreductase [Polyangiaceae bacterium]
MTASPPLAVVTGASRGIGRATALALAARRTRLALIGRASDELDSVIPECTEAGAPELRFFPADLRDLEATARAGAAVLGELGAPDIVIHNAGVVHRVAVEELELELFREQLDVNLGAPYALTRAFLPALRAAGRGRILFVGSISGTLGTPHLSAYCASKWGIIGFMKSLAEEISGTGLMTCAVLPGSVPTRMLEGSGFPPRMTTEDVARTLA